MTTTLLQQFLAEAADLLDLVDTGLLALEREPHDRARLDEVFRAAHTFKGSSGLFDLPELTRLTHAAEDLLDAVRADRLALTSVMIDDLLQAFDLVRGWLVGLDATQTLPPDAAVEGAALAVRLRAPLGEGPEAARVPRQRADDAVPASARGSSRVAPGGPGSGSTPSAPAWVLDLLGSERTAAVRDWLVRARTSCRVVRFVPDEQAFFTGTDPLHLVSTTPALEQVAVVPREPWPALADLDEYRCVLAFCVVTRATGAELAHQYRYVAEETTIVEVDAAALSALLDPALVVVADVELGAALDAGVPDGTPNVAPEAPAGPGRHIVLDQEEQAPGGEGHGGRSASGRVLKVDQVVVDRLLDLVGQLVVAKNGLPFLARSAEVDFEARALGRQIKDQYAVVDRIAEDLQSAVMDVRMMPLSVAFARLPRMVRDLSRALGKQVVLEQEGQETTADKDVIEMLADPLVHLVRNSLDHGIETPAERVAAGKAPEATLSLRVGQEPDAVVVDLVDDGRGIDPQVVRRRALARGLLSADELEALSDEEAVDLVFVPGFSTAEQISDVSGRGVGMDAVRASVQATGGSVRISSEVGRGTRVRLRLPLSMAVSRVMIVTVAGQRFGVPIDVVLETVRVPRERLVRVREHEAIVLRDAVIPLLHLGRALQLSGTAAEDDLVSVLVTRSHGGDVGLVVQSFQEGTDVILKPLDGVLAQVRGFCGTALLGDGSVLLVLDVKEVLAGAAVVG